MKAGKEQAKAKKKEDEILEPISRYFDHIFVLVDFQNDFLNSDLSFFDINVHFGYLNFTQIAIESTSTKGLSYKDIIAQDNLDKIIAPVSRLEELRICYEKILSQSKMHSRIRNSIQFEIPFTYIETSDKAIIGQCTEHLQKTIVDYVNISEEKLCSYNLWLSNIKIKKYTFPARNIIDTQRI